MRTIKTFVILASLPLFAVSPCSQNGHSITAAIKKQLDDAAKIQNAESGFAAYRKISAAAEQAGDALGVAESEYQCGIAHARLRHWDQAAFSFDSAATQFERVGTRSRQADSLYHAGDTSDSAKDDVKALNYYGHALQLDTDLRDFVGQAKCLIGMGVAYMNSPAPRIPKATECLKRALRLSNDIKDERLIAASLLNLSGVIDPQRDPKGLRAKLIEALQHAKAAPSSVDNGFTFQGLASAFHELHDEPHAAVCWNQADKMLEPEPYPRADLLNEAGATLEGDGNFAEAVSYFDRALSVTQTDGDWAAKSESFTGYGRVYEDLGQLNDSIGYYQRALATLNEHNQPGEAVLSFIAEVYALLGKPKSALDYYLRSLARVQPGSEDEAQLLGDIGSTYNDIGNETQALEFLYRACRSLTRLGKWDSLAIAWNNIGLVYTSLGDQDRALDYYRQAFLEASDPRGDVAARALENIGAVFAQEGSSDMAVSYYNRALSLLLKLPDVPNQCTVMSRVGRIFLAKSEERRSPFYCDRALDYFQEVLPKQRQYCDRAGESSSLANIGVAYSILKDYPKSFQCLCEAIPIATETSNPKIESESLSDLGRAALMAKLPNAGIAFLKRGLNIHHELAKGVLGLGQGAINAFSKQEGAFYDRLESALASEGRKDEEAAVLRVRTSVSLDPIAMTENERAFLDRFDQMEAREQSVDAQAAELQRVLLPSRPRAEQLTKLRELRERIQTLAKETAKFVSSIDTQPITAHPTALGTDIAACRIKLAKATKVVASKCASDPGSGDEPNISTAVKIAIIFASTGHYQNSLYKDLINPGVDATRLRTLLHDDFGFDARIVPNPDLDTVNRTLDAIYELHNNPADEILIYFAGHGCEKRVGFEQGGYVVLTSSKEDDPSMSSYFKLKELRDGADGYKANHVLVVLDVCYGADFDPKLFGGGTDEDAALTTSQSFCLVQDARLSRDLTKKSRQFLASGTRKVPNGSERNGSPFSRVLLDHLKGAKSAYILADDLDGAMRHELNSDPQGGRFGSDKGGEFVFVAPSYMVSRARANHSQP